MRIANEHANVVLVERNGETLLKKDVAESRQETDAPDYSLLTVADICDFAATCNLADVAPVLRRQIALNSAIADEGLKNDYGANIGKVLLQTGSDVRTRAKARAATASAPIGSGSRALPKNRGHWHRSPSIAQNPALLISEPP